MGDCGHGVPIVSYGRFDKERVNSVLSSALLCGLVCPLLPFLGPLLSSGSHILFSAASQNQPGSLTKVLEYVDHRWTLWSQVRGTQGPSWPLRCSPALCYLSSHVSVHSVSTFCSLSQNQTSPPLCRGSHQGSAFCGLIVERSAWLVLASVSCPRFFLGSLQPPFFLASTIYI